MRRSCKYMMQIVIAIFCVAVLSGCALTAKNVANTEVGRYQILVSSPMKTDRDEVFVILKCDTATGDTWRINCWRSGSFSSARWEKLK
jgi:hypothetical protein